MTPWARVIASAFRPVALIALLSFAGALAARAAPILPLPSTVTYTLTADSSAVFGNETAAISGSFGYSAEQLIELGTEAPCGVIFTVTGNGPFAGVYGEAPGVLGATCELFGGPQGSGVDAFQGVDLDFFLNLALPFAYLEPKGPIFKIIPLHGAADDYEPFISIDVTGCAVLGTTVYASCFAAEEAIPEPASLTLFGSALAGLGVLRKRRALIQ